MSAPRHPTDAEREAAGLQAVEGLLDALRSGSADAARPHLRDDVVWLNRGGRSDGPDAAVAGIQSLIVPGRGWTDPQRSGAHAVLRYGEDGDEGGLVIETRRAVVVLLVAVP